MPGIFSSLNSAAHALQAHSRSVEQAGKNIANVNNPHYTRQRVVTGSLGSVQSTTGVQNSGLQALGVQQVRETYIERQLLGEVAYESGLKVQETRLSQALANLGESIDRINDPLSIDDSVASSGGIRGSIDKFFDAFESLSASPNDATLKHVVYQSAEEMVDNFNRIDQRFQLMEAELAEQIEMDANAFNQKLAEIDNLNIEISRYELSNPGGALDLRDERQRLLEEVSAYASIDVVENADFNGQITINVSDQNGGVVSILEPGFRAKEIFFDATSQSLNIVGSGEALDLGAGSLPALLELRGTHVAEIRDELNLMANNVATEVNEIYYQAYDATTAPVTPEISFFQQPTPPPSISGVPSTVTAASIALYMAPSGLGVGTDFVALEASSLRSSDSIYAGANDIALAIADVANQQLAGIDSLTLSEYAARTVSSLGQEISGVQDRLVVQSTVVDLLNTQRSEVSGVSMDEEVSNMVQYQQAYQASSRYFNVLSEMMDTLINSLG
tara:strand:- start:1542 stop:3050 length:1509 start_codon:yes stop_codon:yes gene_type:complete